MADTIKPAHHAWDHLPGGEDPLPGYDWCRIYIHTSGTIPVLSGVNKTISFGTVENTNSDLFSPSLANIEVLADGFYFLRAQSQWTTYGTVIPSSIRESWIVVTRSGEDGFGITNAEPSPLNDYVNVNGWERLQTGDLVSLRVHQDSGFTNTLYKGEDGSSTNPAQDGNYLEVAFINSARGTLSP